MQCELFEVGVPSGFDFNKYPVDTVKRKKKQKELRNERKQINIKVTKFFNKTCFQLKNDADTSRCYKLE